MSQNRRVMIFIDGSNLYHNLKANYGKASLDFGAFRDKLCNGRDHIRTYYYNSPINRDADEKRYREQQRFLGRLCQIPYFDVKLGRLQNKGNGKFTEKGVDVKLAVDMLTKAYKNQYDVTILVSGDADFVQVVEEIKNLAKHVELAYFPNQPCYHLKNEVDNYIQLTPEFLQD